MAERSPGGASFSRVSLVAAGGALLVVGFLWGRNYARRSASVCPTPPVPDEAKPVAPLAPRDAEVDAVGSNSIMKAELERLAGVAMSHGPEDPAIDVFLAFVGALDPLPAAATLEPAAHRIGRPRLVEALDRPGESCVGARRLLAAAQDASEDDGFAGSDRVDA